MNLFPCPSSEHAQREIDAPAYMVNEIFSRQHKLAIGSHRDILCGGFGAHRLVATRFTVALGARLRSSAPHLRYKLSISGRRCQGSESTSLKKGVL